MSECPPKHYGNRKTKKEFFDNSLISELKVTGADIQTYIYVDETWLARVNKVAQLLLKKDVKQ